MTITPVLCVCVRNAPTIHKLWDEKQTGQEEDSRHGTEGDSNQFETRVAANKTKLEYLILTSDGFQSFLETPLSRGTEWKALRSQAAL